MPFFGQLKARQRVADRNPDHCAQQEGTSHLELEFLFESCRGKIVRSPASLTFIERTVDQHGCGNNQNV